jgi:hypothetical protein
MFKVGDLVKIVSSDYDEHTGHLGLVVGIDYNIEMHSFPMYVLTMLPNSDAKYVYPSDIEGVSLVNREASPVVHKGTI